MSVAWFGRQKKENELPEIRAYAPGIYARSEKLVQATRDLDRGRTTEEAAEEQRLADLRAFNRGPEGSRPRLLLGWPAELAGHLPAIRYGCGRAAPRPPDALFEHKHVLPGSGGRNGETEAGRTARRAVFPDWGASSQSLGSDVAVPPRPN